MASLGAVSTQLIHPHSRLEVVCANGGQPTIPIYFPQHGLPSR